MRHRPLSAALSVLVAACAPALRPLPFAPPAAPVVLPVDPAPAVAPAAATPAPDPVVAPTAAAPSASGRLDPAAAISGAEPGARAAVSALEEAAVAEVAAVEPLALEPYETHDRVAHYVALFSGTARTRTAERLTRGTRFEPMIRAKLRTAGIPDELYYLALIESGFDPNAYSRAAAVGMWQFMTTTARGVGMRVDHWVDERRDPVRSTDGAITFLQALKEQFGSYYLAAAAYNGGPGRVSRGLSRYAEEIEGAAADDQFFALAEKSYLRAETRNYVPQLIAAALIGRDPARYGIRVDTQPPFAYDSVRVPPATALAAVARAAGVPLDAVQSLNPQVLKGVAPPTDSVALRVPPGTGVLVTLALDTMPEAARSGLVRHVTRKGETVTSLARRHGTTAARVRAYNPRLRALKSGAVSAGQVVWLPTADALLAARSVPDPSIERYGSSRATAGRTHRVQRGESLSTIARRYGTTVATLKRLNGMRGDRVLAGQTLIVRGAPAGRR